MIFVLERIIKETYSINNEYGTADMALSCNLSDREPDEKTVYPPIIIHVLTNQSSGQETPVCNCAEWKDITAGLCPVHGTANSCR